MASVDIAKMPPAALMGLEVHFENSIRMRAKHSNTEIDPALSPDNYYIGCESWRECADRMQDFIAEIDEKQPPQRIRPDRKTWISIYVPCPKAITDAGRADDFFQKSYDLIDRILPGGLFGGQVHKDEIHSYKDHYDKESKEWVEVESLEHEHLFAPAFTPEKGINCKSLCTRELYQRVQDEMQEMVQKEFGISYQTGAYDEAIAQRKEKAKFKKTVEELKLESVRAEVESQRAEKGRMQSEIAQLKEDTTTTEKELIEAQDALTAVKEETAKTSAEQTRLEKVTDSIKRILFDLMDRFMDLYQGIKLLNPPDIEIKVLRPAKEKVDKEIESIYTIRNAIKGTGKVKKNDLETVKQAEKAISEVITDLEAFENEEDDKEL